MDSRKLHRGEKGEHETQVLEGGEADIYRHFTTCTKNPDHSGFTPVNSFDIAYLPEAYQDYDLYKLIKTLADMTVRICVTVTSSERPKVWPNTEDPYPFSDSRESKIPKTGTGRVVSLVRYSNGYNLYKDTHYKGDRSCKCHDCVTTHFPQKVWWEIKVSTATHVVFDDIEAKSMVLRFFFDEIGSPLESLSGASVLNADIEKDKCMLIIVTCNTSLGSRLFDIWKDYNRNLENVYTKYKSLTQLSGLTVIVSHPHGCPKMISVGRCTKVVQDGPHCFNNKLFYTTCTCKGSSGAPVLCLDYIGWDPQVHRGTSKDEQLNYSGPGPIGREKPSKYNTEKINLYV